MQLRSTAKLPTRLTSDQLIHHPKLNSLQPSPTRRVFFAQRCNRGPEATTLGLASQLLLGNVSRIGATELKSFKATVASFLSNTFLLGSSVALSIHVVLTFFRMHGLALTLAFVAFWLICVTAYFRWQGKQSIPRTVSKNSTQDNHSRKPTEAWRERQSA